MDGGTAFFIMEDGKGAMGCVAVEKSKKSPDVFYMKRLSVLPEFRRRGAGGLLLRHAVREAVAMGAGRVEIGIIADQAELRRWYEGHGFRVKGEKRFDHLPFTVTFLGTDV
jgi:ribosomal protein S18 acetylase RimI-like enzyme